MKKWIEAATPNSLLSKMLWPLIVLSFGILAVWYDPFLELVLGAVKPKLLLQTVFALLILLISSLAYFCFLINRIVFLSDEINRKNSNQIKDEIIKETNHQKPNKPDMRGVFRR